jgi:SlyX protein
LPQDRQLSVVAPPLAGGRRYNSQMIDEQLEQIQSKIAFLERAASELSDVVFRQHKEIQALEAKLEALSDRLSGAQSDESAPPPDQERPPHY